MLILLLLQEIAKKLLCFRNAKDLKHIFTVMISEDDVRTASIAISITAHMHGITYQYFSSSDILHGENFFPFHTETILYNGDERIADFNISSVHVFQRYKDDNGRYKKRTDDQNGWNDIAYD